MPKAATTTRRGKAAAARSDPLRKPNAGRSNASESAAEDAPSNETGKAASSKRTTKGDRTTSTPSNGSNPSNNAASTTTSGPTTPASDANYLLMVHVLRTDFPCVSRLLSVPPSFTFAKLHGVLQIAFGWASCHAHGFSISTTENPKTMMSMGGGFLRPKLTIVTDDFGLDMPGDEKKVLEGEITLGDVYENPEFGGKAKVMYNYDFGDDWDHEIALIGRATPDSNAQMSAPEELKVFCLGGEGHPVAEDSGSAPGWEDLKENFKKGKRGASGDDRRSWYKKMCANGDPKGLDPYKWDILDVNDALVQKFSPELLAQEAQAQGKSKGKGGKTKKKA